MSILAGRRSLLLPRGGITSASLQASLVGYWRLDEASGSRADSSGNSNTLTDNNTVGSTTGKVGTAANFIRANSERLTRADQASFEVGSQSFTMCGWLRLTTLPGVAMIVAGKYSTSASKGWKAQVDSSNRMTLYVEGNSFQTAVGATLSTATWYFIAAWWDPADDKARVQVNMGTINESAVDTGISPFPDGTAPFVLGSSDLGSLALDGDMDEWGLWIGRVLTQAELSHIHNSGSGRQLF